MSNLACVMLSDELSPLLLRAGEQVFSHVLEKAEQCPRASGVITPPPSWSDALAVVANREEEKRKKDAIKKDTKSKASRSLSASDLSELTPPPPGTLIGNLPDQSVFWMYMEVGCAQLPWCQAALQAACTSAHALHVDCRDSPFPMHACNACMQSNTCTFIFTLFPPLGLLPGPHCGGLPAAGARADGPEQG